MFVRYLLDSHCAERTPLRLATFLLKAMSGSQTTAEPVLAAVQGERDDKIIAVHADDPGKPLPPVWLGTKNFDAH